MDTTWALALPLVILLPTLWLLAKNNKNKSNLPPRPPGIPIVSRLLWMRTPLLGIAPILRRLRTQVAPVVTLDVGLLPSIFVIDRRIAHEALIQKGNTFSDRPPSGVASALLGGNGYSINIARGSVWHVLRRNLATEMVQASRLRSFAGFRRRILGELLGDLRDHAASENGVVDFSSIFRHSQYRLFILMCFGEEMPDDSVVEKIEQVQEDLIPMYSDLGLFDIAPPTRFFMRGKWRRFLEINRRRHEVMAPLIEARRSIAADRDRSSDGERPISGSCYVDTLLNLKLEGSRKLTVPEIVALCAEFFFAGMDTTSSAVVWAMANLVKHPHVQRRLHEEIARVVPEGRREIEEEDLQKMPYLKAVVLETLRRHPPGQFLIPHVAAEDAQLGGYEIPKGSVLNFPAAGMGWDAEVWEDPLEFRPERFVDGGEGEGVDLTGSRVIRMIPFGAGKRSCPGMGMALLHLHYYVASMVRELEWKTSVEGEEVDLSEKLEMTVSMKNPPRVRILERRYYQ